MKDVVFVEDVKTVPIGKVIKVDGNYVAVKFFSKDAKEKEKELKEKDFSTSDFKDMTAEEMIKLLAYCRLLRKDELQVQTFLIIFFYIWKFVLMFLKM